MRFVLGLLAAVAVYFGWQWYRGPAAPPEFGDLYQVAAAQSGPAVAAPAAKPVGEPDPPQSVPLQAKGTEQIVARLRAADAAALRTGFHALLEAPQPVQGQIEAALRAVAARAASTEALLQVLGGTNAFTHSEAGRELAREAAARIRRMPSDKAVAASTALLEKCLRGPLTKADNAAYDLINEIYDHHRLLVDQVVFNPSRLTQARSYKVRSGETLGGIAARFRGEGLQIEGWTLCILNRIGRPELLQAGKTIKIPTEPIHARLEKSSFALGVFVGEAMVRLYWVGHGKAGCDTPETTFTVVEKLPNPDWDAPDGNRYPFGHPKNVLGRFFLKFDHPSFHGFGAHGTSEPESIRTRSSLGCIRMRDADIEEFFRFFPRGARIVVTASR